MNPIKGCKCPQCRWGLRHYVRSKAVAKAAVRRLRHITKQALRRGEEPPLQISRGYTD